LKAYNPVSPAIYSFYVDKQLPMVSYHAVNFTARDNYVLFLKPVKPSLSFSNIIAPQEFAGEITLLSDLITI